MCKDLDSAQMMAKSQFGRIGLGTPVLFSDLQWRLEARHGRRGAPIRGKQDCYGIHQAERRVGMEHRLGQVLEPAPQRVILILDEFRGNEAFDEIGSAWKVLGRQRGLNRFCEPSVLFIPETRPVRQRPQMFFAQAPPRLVLHGLGKERVIAIPLPGTVERDQKQVGAFQVFEEHLTVIPARHRMTERTGQAAEDTRPQDKIPGMTLAGR